MDDAQYATVAGPSFAMEPPTPMDAASALEYQQRAQALASQTKIASPGSQPIFIPRSPASRPSSASETSPAAGSHRHHPYDTLSTSRPRRERSVTSNSSAGGNDLVGDLEGTSPALAGVASPASNADVTPFELDLDGGLRASASPAPAPAQSPAAASTESPEVKPVRKSHARKTPADHIKRPPNAFILFRSHCCAPAPSPDGVVPPGTPSAEQLSKLGITDHRHISRIVSHLWESLSAPDKKYWQDLAQEKKDEHARLYPDYRFKPVFRDSSAVRRKKRTGLDETRVEVTACAKVAAQLLGLSDGDEMPQVRMPGDKRAKKPRKSRAKPKLVKPAQPEEVDELDDSIEPARSRWTMDTVRASLRKDPVPPPPPKPAPAKRPFRPRRTRRTQRDSAATAPPSTSESLVESESELSTFEQQQQQAFRSVGYATSSSQLSTSASSVSSIAPPGPQQSYLGQFDYLAQQQPAARADFSRIQHQLAPPPMPIRRESHTRTRSHTGDFAFVSELDDIMATQARQQYQSIPMSNQHSLDPRQLESPGSSRPPTRSRKSPPTPLELPHNPKHLQSPFEPQLQAYQPVAMSSPASPRSVAIQGLQDYQLAQSQTMARSVSVAGADRTPRPASPRSGALIAAPVAAPGPGSPTSRVFSFAGFGPDLPHPVAPGRRDSDLMLAAMGMKRRGTIGRALNGQAADLMLVSPSTATFGERRFSLGRWEVGRVPSGITAVGGGKTGYQNAAVDESVPMDANDSPTGMTAFEADQELLDLLAKQPFPTDFNAPLEPLVAANGQGLAIPVNVTHGSRPGTGHSNYSSRPGTGSSEVSEHELDQLVAVERQHDAMAATRYWTRSASIDKAAQYHKQQQQYHQQYHVGHEDFFVAPQGPFMPVSDWTPSLQPQQHPAMGSAAFGDSFRPHAHRQSLDEQLAAEYAAQQQQQSSHIYGAQARHLSPQHGIYDWSPSGQRDRGSDATVTLRGRQDSLRSYAASHAELEMLQEQLRNPEKQLEMQEQAGFGEAPGGHADEPDVNTTYIMLTPEQAKDAALVDQILK